MGAPVERKRGGDMIEVDGLVKTYGSVQAVQGLSFAVRKGEILGLVGPNGAGKTTTLRCMTGIIPPTVRPRAHRRLRSDRRSRSRPSAGWPSCPTSRACSTT